MMISNIAIILLSAVITVLLFHYGYVVRKDMELRKNQFDIQMKSASTNSLQNAMKFEDIRSMLNTLITFYTTQYVSLGAFDGKSTEELSVILQDTEHGICVDIRLAMSKQLLNQWLLYSTEKFIDEYIAFSVLTVLVNTIEKKKNQPS
jgi:hypothetical protein